MSQLKPGIDYYLLPDGRLVFTESYHLNRGFCCGKGCMHCPFGYQNVEEPKRTELLMKRTEREKGKQ